jgi:hypothetical protein
MRKITPLQQKVLLYKFHYGNTNGTRIKGRKPHFCCRLIWLLPQLLCLLLYANLNWHTTRQRERELMFLYGGGGAESKKTTANKARASSNIFPLRGTQSLYAAERSRGLLGQTRPSPPWLSQLINLALDSPPTPHPPPPHTRPIVCAV